MPMTLGSITVANDGSVTKSGVVGRCYDELLAALTVTLPTGAAGAVFKRQLAGQATAQARALYDTLTIDAKTRVTQEDNGLQRIPASTAENTPCKGPAETRFLTIV